MDFVEANDVASYDGEMSLFVNSLASDEEPFHLDYGRLDGNTSKEAVWNLGVDYIYHLVIFPVLMVCFDPMLEPESVTLMILQQFLLLKMGLHGTYRQVLKFYLPKKFPSPGAKFWFVVNFAETDFDLGIT